jgi:hypothetical protein
MYVMLTGEEEDDAKVTVPRKRVQDDEGRGDEKQYNLPYNWNEQEISLRIKRIEIKPLLYTR